MQAKIEKAQKIIVGGFATVSLLTQTIQPTVHLIKKGFADGYKEMGIQQVLFHESPPKVTTKKHK
jgi:hypothetical protein